MARLPAATRESVPPEQVEEFDRIVETIGRVPPVGPYSALIHAPKALRLADGLNQYLRNESSLSLKTLELAMLVVARELDCQHIWNDHARVAQLTVTMGDYALLAFLVNAFDPDLPPNRAEPLLPG